MTDFKQVCFRDVAWLQNRQLTRDTVLDYLALSPFWDSTSSNDMLKMQLRYQSTTHPTTTILDGHQLQSRLEQMTSGVEFVVAEGSVDDRTLVVLKRRRLRPGSAPGATTLMAVIYVMDGTAFAAPTLADVATARLAGCLAQLSAAFDYAQGNLRLDSIGGRWRGSQDSDVVMHPTEAVETAQLNALNGAFYAKIHQK